MVINIQGLFENHEKMIRIKSQSAYEKKMAEFRENQGACLQEYYNRIDFDEDKEQALEQASEQFAKEAFASFEKKGRVKMNRLGPLNLYMVFFVFPTILQERYEDGTEICESLKTQWNKVFLGATIGYADYETLKSGFRTTFLGIPIGKSK